MKHWLWLMVGGFSALTACHSIECHLIFPPTMTVHGVRPEHPKIGNPNSPTTVEDLRPLLGWKRPDWAGPDATYDLIIYEGVEVDGQWLRWTPGRDVYFREGLKEPKHRVKKLLKPETVYFWSLRVRRAEKISDWSGYDYEFSHPWGSSSCRRGEYAVPFFIFETPDK